MPKCKYPNKACVNMTILNGIAFCDSVPCSIKDEVPKRTNADRIRSMTNEQLAGFLCKGKFSLWEPCMTGEKDCKWEDYPTHDKGCKDCFKEWLERET